jgi:hypothetical protein
VTNFTAGSYQVWTTGNHNTYDVPANGSFPLTTWRDAGNVTIYINGTSYGSFDVASAPAC